MFLILLLSRCCAYRLGDIVKEVPSALKCACENPESIGCIFTRRWAAHQREVSRQQKIGMLVKILEDKIEKRPWFKSPPNVTCIHVRAGDGLLGPDCFTNQTQCLKGRTSGQYYSKSKPFFEALEIPRLPILFYASTTHMTHHRTPYEWQRKYILEVASYMELFGPVIFKVNSEVDETFINLATADVLFTTGGGFGKLVREVFLVLRS